MFAVSAIEAGSYVGLVLDDVRPPLRVSTALDVQLSGWRGETFEDDLAPLIRRLQKRSIAQHSFLEQVARSVQHMALQLRKLSARLRAWGILAAFTAVGAIVGLATGLMALWEVVPSPSQLADWRKIARSDDCAAFEAYIGQYGPTGFKVEEAKQRVELAQPVTGPLAMAPLAVVVPSYEQPPTISQAQAAASALASGGRQAIDRCRAISSAYAGEAAPGVFRPVSSPVCHETTEGFQCTVRGEIHCRVLAEGVSRRCAPPS